MIITWTSDDSSAFPCNLDSTKLLVVFVGFVDFQARIMEPGAVFAMRVAALDVVAQIIAFLADAVEIWVCFAPHL